MDNALQLATMVPFVWIPAKNKSQVSQDSFRMVGT